MLTNRQGAFTIAGMSTASQPATDASGLWDRYRDNFSRHLIGVSRYLQTRMMRQLTESCGHRDLRLGYAPYITLVGETGVRLADLAAALGISRQACNQAVQQIEAAGYIARQADPSDGRAKRVVLTARGSRLRRDGARTVTELDAQFGSLLGEAAVADAARTLRRLYTDLGLGLQTAVDPPVAYSGIGGLLPRLTDYTLQRLMELTIARGHPSLKLSYGQVLTLVGPDGGRIQQMAAAQDVSKQAISAVATELESLGYLRREIDSDDGRQVLLQFTAAGEALIADSVASVDALEEEFASITGRRALARLNGTLRSLYNALCLEREVFERPSGGAVDIALLAQQLQKQLGEPACRALAALLSAPDSKTR